MGDLNQLAFIKKNIKKFKAPYLEIGSRYGLTREMRKLFLNSEYIGTDMDGYARVLTSKNTPTSL